jgi:AraC family transcriptional regulator of adaptative response / DNA-3-methyladenine glycosylase II
VESPFAALTTAFPLPGQVASLEIEELVRLGILRARARTILELAKAVAEGAISLVPGIAVDETVGKLQSIAGIGQWTAQYIAMRALAWPDAFPHTDLGVMKALGERNPKRVLAAAEAWRPWRAYAVMHLWAAGNSNGSVH